MEVYYTEPDEDKPCLRCKHRRHDTCLSELWCNHDPAPNGIYYRRVIGEWGTCEYWEEWKYLI